VHDSGVRALAAVAADDSAKIQSAVAAMRQASGRVLQCLDAFGAEYPATFGTVEAEGARHHTTRRLDAMMSANRGRMAASGWITPSDQARRRGSSV
jgi:hypothetical protein